MVQFLDAHRLRNTSANAAGLGGVECLDLVPFENSGLAVSPGQVTSGLRSGLEGSRIPPPPVPCVQRRLSLRALDWQGLSR